MRNRAARGCIFQFRPMMRAAEHQPAPAHVASPDKFAWNDQTLAKNIDKRRGIFWRCETAEQHVDAVGAGSLIENSSVSFQRAAVTRILDVYSNLRDGLEIVHRDVRFGSEQTAAGRDNKRAREPRRGQCERASISKFAAEIETANERVQFAERGALSAQPDREIELRSIVQDHFGAFAAGVRRG